MSFVKTGDYVRPTKSNYSWLKDRTKYLRVCYANDYYILVDFEEETDYYKDNRLVHFKPCFEAKFNLAANYRSTGNWEIRPPIIDGKIVRAI